MKMLKRLQQWYNWFWWHTEIWITDTKLRRPYTYLFRDHPLAYIGFAVAVCIGALFTPTWLMLTLFLGVGVLTGHVWWGTRIDRWQQEFPEYNPIEESYK